MFDEAVMFKGNISMYCANTVLDFGDSRGGLDEELIREGSLFTKLSD